MPKLQDREVERNQEKIEAAALRLFIHRGFHGTSVRDIAAGAGVSLGNIYNYYRTKDQLYSSLVRRYQQRMTALQRKILAPLGSSLDPATLKRLALGVRRIVYQEPDYWRLMYIDVTEFGNRHFARSFRDLSRTLPQVTQPASQTRNGVRSGIDYSLAYTAIYLQFFTYFLVEKLFGGKRHLGLQHDRAIAQLIEIFAHGALANSHAMRQIRRRRP